MRKITETCAICGEVCEGYDDGISLSHWPDGTFMMPNGPWICVDCIPDGFKFKDGTTLDQVKLALAEQEAR